MKSPKHFRVFAAVLFFLLTACGNDLTFDQLAQMQLIDHTGNSIDIARFKGKNIFVNFWATWCGPCLVEMPSIETARQELEKENFFFVAISDEPLEKIADFKATQGQNYRFLIAKKVLQKGEDEMKSFPETYLIDSKGKTVFKKIGSAKWDEPEMLTKLRELAKTN